MASQGRLTRIRAKRRNGLNTVVLKIKEGRNGDKSETRAHETDTEKTWEGVRR